jgi:hypothetical protein
MAGRPTAPRQVGVRSPPPQLIYAGIGSRRTPPVALELMTELARLLAARGWTLRTGGADGADTAFMNGCLLCEPRYELYLPWPGFSSQAPATLTRPTAEASAIAARYHPRWALLKHAERQLHARNVHQVLGAECTVPVAMVVCWTPDGSLDGQGPDCGGTGMALRVAVGEAPSAPVFNLARGEHWNRLATFADPGGKRFHRRERHEQVSLL